MAFQSAAAAAAISTVPIFSPAPPSPTRRPPTELRFSRWNNVPARRLRPQKEIEDDIRRERRFRSAIAIADDADGDRLPSPPPSSPKSAGTPSSPSRSSIPGRASKYSKPPKAKTLTPSHPAFRRLPRVFDRPATAPEVSVGVSGVSYRVPNAPFEFQYSYTETPKVRPLKLREPPVTPFGPVTMPRPWTGRRPLPGTKKLLPEFDSFRLPPPHKKGVKPVQAPGPFLAGSGPRYVMSREEILGEPLTKDEITDLVRASLKTRRQLNMGN